MLVNHFIWEPEDIVIDGELPEPFMPLTVTWRPEGQKEFDPDQPREPNGRWVKIDEGDSNSGDGDGSDRAVGFDVPGARTPFDTAEVVAARAEQEGLPSTHLIDTPERQALRASIVAKLDAQNGVWQPKPEDKYTVKQERRADLILGPPAAGKSSLADPMRREVQSRLIDADEVKAGLPEFANGRHAGTVHEESSLLTKGPDGVLERALMRGDNIMFPLVGENSDKVDKLGASLVAAGYTVHLHLVDLPIEQAAQRVVTRFEQTGRFVDPEFVLSIGDRPKATYIELKDRAWNSGGTAVTTDGVKPGEKPIVLNL